MEDHQLVELCRQGQAQHFAILVEKYRRTIFGLAWHLLRSRTEAEDVCQEALLRVYRQIQRQSGIDFLPYTKRVLTNLCLDALRHRQVERKYLQPEAEYEAEDWRTPEQSVMQAADRQTLRQALLGLPDMYREVLTLHYAAGLSYQEIALQLQQPLSIVKNRLFRAKRLLKSAYLQLEGDEPDCVVNK